MPFIQSTALVVLIASIACLLPFLASTAYFKGASKSVLYCVSISTYSITTLNESLPRAQCFRVRNGIFTEILASVPVLDGEEIVHLDGYVLPGIIESHGHILGYGEMLESVALYGAQSIDEVRDRIKEFLALHKSEGYGTRDKWLRGIGWDQTFFGGTMPTAVCQLFLFIYPSFLKQTLTRM